jgi:FkbM family methyltransferase
VPYFAPLRHLQESLRARVRRGSWFWRFLVALKATTHRLRAAALRPRWERAANAFAAALQARAEAHRVAGTTFFFVQVGAHDGSMDDPLAADLARHADHWRGLFIEPQPEQFSRLVARHAARPEQHRFERLAVDRLAGERQFHRVAAAHVHIPELSGLASLYPDRGLAPQLALGRTETFTVRCEPLASILTRHDLAHFDLLQIDTEGHDAVVLETLDLVRHRPQLIRFEHRHLSGKELRRCTARLHAHAYLVTLGQHDAFAVSQTEPGKRQPRQL